jgi:hypothetical protein
VPGGPRGLQNRRRPATAGMGSIPILSANSTSASEDSRGSNSEDRIDVAFILRRMRGQTKPNDSATSLARPAANKRP